MIRFLSFVVDNTGIMIGSLFFLLNVVAIVRIIIKRCRGEQIEITPVGIANDLPDSVTGMNKYSDALSADDSHKKE